jgi:hypothetical protein
MTQHIVEFTDRRSGRYRVTYTSAGDDATVVLVEKSWFPPGSKQAWRKLWIAGQEKPMSTGVACAIRGANSNREKEKPVAAQRGNQTD